MSDLRDLKSLLRSRTPLIVVETHEERRVVQLLRQLTPELNQFLYRWTVTEGLKRLDVEMEAQRHARKPLELLTQIKSSQKPGIYVLLDFHPFLEDPVHIRLLKDIAVDYDRLRHTIVLVSHGLNIPREFERYCARFELSFPERIEVEDIVLQEARAWMQRNPGQRLSTDRETIARLAENLLGLPRLDVRRLARGVIEDDGALSELDIPKIARAKFELLGRDGVLSFEYDTARFSEVGGLAQLKRWLAMRQTVFTQTDSGAGLDPPKGILLLGIQGGGKSLAAKAVAGAWGVPLLRLDFGALYNKFYGETEKNLRESLKTAEIMEPCVLWIDEIEKAISSDSHDGGTSRRVLGSLLTWMAERRSRVFLVATANDIESLPPELLRKGRLDEIFFVDLPDEETRAIIFDIHLKRRGQDVNTIDLDMLADISEGFSGSEIEQAVVSALYRAHAEAQSLETIHLQEEISATRPLSIVMAEKMHKLRLWAQDRTVPAH